MYGAELTPLTEVLQHKDPNAAFYQLIARSIREGFPPVAIDDAVILKQIRWHNGTSQEIALEARIFSIRRAVGTVILRCDALRQYQESMSFVVAWMPQAKTFEAAHLAIATIQMALSAQAILPKPSKMIANKVHAGISGASTAKFGQQYSVRSIQAWMLPEREHLLSPMTDPKAAAIEFINTSLNVEQQDAVRAIATGNRLVPFLISGVPGSGKTMALVESVLQILKHRSDAHVLVVGASHPSADTLTSRLSSYLKNHEMLRLIDPSRPIEETTPLLHRYCCLDQANRTFTVPALSRILSYRIVVVTAMDSSLLVKYHADNSSLQLLGRHLQNGLQLKTISDPSRPHWTHLLIDEAGQIHEPETAIALSVVMPITSQEGHRPPQVVLCGDVMQLGPQILSDQARDLDLDCSLLGRLLERPLYANHPEARGNIRSTRQTFDPDKPFVNLVRNYRSAIGILAPVATMFYNDSLIPCARDAIVNSRLLEWPELCRPGFPLAVFGMDALEEDVDEGESWHNPSEVQKVVELVNDLLVWASKQKIQLSPSEISVISPFRENVWRIRLALRKIGLFEVDVGNVEALQGAENRVVILSTVRSRERFLEADTKRGRGLFMEARRLCVALSRAKELQIVIGNAQLLSREPWWKIFLSYAVRQKCYSGPDLKLVATEGMTYLETQFPSSYSLDNGQMDPTEAASQLAHALAGSALI